MLSSISQKQISTTTTNKHIVHAEVNHDEEQINADPDSSAIAKMPPKRNKQRMRKKSKRHAHGNEQAPPSTVADDVSKPTEDRPVVHWKKAKIATCRQQSPDGNLSNTSINKDGGESQQTTSQQESRDTHDKSDSPPLPNCNPQRGKQLHLHVRKNESLVEIPSGMKMVDGRQVHVITCLPSGSNKQLINMEGDEIMTKTIPADERPGVNLNDSSDGNDIKGFEKGCHQDFAITESGHGDDNLGSKTAVKKRATPFPFAPKFTFTPLGSGKRCSPSCPRCEARIKGPKLELHPAHKSKLRRDHGKSICDKFSAKVKALYERRWYHRENRKFHRLRILRNTIESLSCQQVSQRTFPTSAAPRKSRRITGA